MKIFEKLSTGEYLIYIYDTIFIFQKNNFENYKKTVKYCKHVFLFYKNFISKQRIPSS